MNRLLHGIMQAYFATAGAILVLLSLVVLLLVLTGRLDAVRVDGIGRILRAEPAWLQRSVDATTLDLETRVAVEEVLAGCHRVVVKPGLSPKEQTDLIDLLNAHPGAILAVERLPADVDMELNREFEGQQAALKIREEQLAVMRGYLMEREGKLNAEKLALDRERQDYLTAKAEFEAQRVKLEAERTDEALRRGVETIRRMPPESAAASLLALRATVPAGAVATPGLDVDGVARILRSMRAPDRATVLEVFEDYVRNPPQAGPGGPAAAGGLPPGLMTAAEFELLERKLYE